MISPDANLLIYAYAPSDLRHAASRTWLELILSSPETIGIPILCIHAFLRVMTHPKSAARILTLQQAVTAVDSWLALPHVRILYPGDRHWRLFQHLASTARVTGARLTDAAIAAIAQEHGGTIYSHDTDFARFPGVRWHDPLQP